ncbi:metal-dependent hydrolase [Sphingomonas sp. ASV193]|uniref:metal-dependent hydrolase n=1 Tax=Sphingomonas sp. ASV193 TaxID=3144405 RepID=UPI0032E916CA
MDNITHTLAGGLIAEMGLRKRSRFAFAACLLGANAPDIDVFAPALLGVQGISFHRGPVHSLFAWPILAAGIVAILWLVDRIKPRRADTLPFLPGPLFVVAFLGVLTHPVLDWLTTYAIAMLAPASWRWDSGDAIFIVDWVYLLLMVGGIVASGRRWKRGASDPGRPAQIAFAGVMLYIGLNLAESRWVERTTADQLRAHGIEPALVVASPPPILFWKRTVAWRSASDYGRGDYDPFGGGLITDLARQPLDLDSPVLVKARAQSRRVAAFLAWSRMPVVIAQDGKPYLTDQRYYDPAAVRALPGWLRGLAGRAPFLVPLEPPPQ